MREVHCPECDGFLLVPDGVLRAVCPECDQEILTFQTETE